MSVAIGLGIELIDVEDFEHDGSVSCPFGMSSIICDEGFVLLEAGLHSGK